jgi:YXWGXW repeat-containing protein
MTRLHLAWLALPVLALSACGHEEPPRTTQIIMQPAPQPQATAIVAPGPPPPPQSELVPPPPPGAGPVVWQPGHWMLTSSGWSWQPGQYVPPPPGQTTWVPGRWMQQSTGGWVWMQGHWA